MWQNILLSVISVVLTALVTWLSERLITWLNTKIKNTKYAKYLTDAVSIITGAVKITYQTYVQELKDKDMFNKDAQLEALNKAKDLALAQLSQESKDYIQENFGDIGEWIKNTIESVLYDLKNKNNGDEKVA